MTNVHLHFEAFLVLYRHESLEPFQHTQVRVINSAGWTLLSPFVILVGKRFFYGGTKRNFYSITTDLSQPRNDPLLFSSCLYIRSTFMKHMHTYICVRGGVYCYLYVFALYSLYKRFGSSNRHIHKHSSPHVINFQSSFLI